MRRQERKNAVRLQKMTRDRLRIQQFPLTIRSTLHTEIIIDNHGQQADRHADLFRAFLVEGAIQGATAFGVELGLLPPSIMPTTYPFVPTLDPHLNFPIGQFGVTGVSLITGAVGLLMRGLALIPSWWD